MKFRAFLLEMAESEIMKMIPTSEYMRIKAADPKPLFRAYVIGHEGDSTGKVSSGGEKFTNVVKRWYQSAIRKLHEKIELGLKFFHGHGTTNALDGRVSIGEVVGKALKNIQDRLSVVVAAYIQPEFRNLPLDVASIEAKVFLNEGDGVYEADVEKVSAIALGSSHAEIPGFAGATLLGEIQAFAQKSQNINFGENKTMTLEEIKKAIQEGKLTPSDLFDSDGIFSDPVIKKEVAEKIKNARGYDGRKFEDLVEEKSKLNEKIKEQETEIKTLKTETAKGKVGDLFAKMKEKRELDEKEVKFIEKRIDKFEPEDSEKLESELDKFVDDLVDEFTEIRTDVFDEKIEGESEGNGGEGKAKAGESEGKTSITSPRKGDPSKKKNEFDENVLIPD